LREKVEWLFALSKDFHVFLQNVGSQVVLLSFAILIGRKLDFTKFDFSGWQPTAVFFALLLAYCYSLFANFSVFFAELMRQPDILRRRINREINSKSDTINALRIANVRRVCFSLWFEISVIFVFFLIFTGLFVATIIGAMHAAQGLKTVFS
jgi:hypothetical protein